MYKSVKELMIENGILQHQANDWEAKYKHLLYEELPKLTAENESLIQAIKKLIYERDCAIEDINNLANWVCDDDLYYLEFGENEQGEEVYISVTIKTKDGKYKEIWRGVRR